MPENCSVLDALLAFAFLTNTFFLSLFFFLVFSEELCIHLFLQTLAFENGVGFSLLFKFSVKVKGV